MPDASRAALWPLVSARPLPRIHVLSDVHLEFGPYELPADLEFDILVAAGDIGPVEHAIPWLARCGRPVVYVLGNHEFYGCEFGEVLGHARALARGTRVRVLERGRVEIAGVRFLGTTLWSSYGGWHPGLVRQAYAQMSDYRHIRATDWFASARNRAWLARHCGAVRLEFPRPRPGSRGEQEFHPAIAYREHLRSVAWLQRELARPFDGATVVVTHHAPTYRSLEAFGIDAGSLNPMAWNTPEYQESLRRVAAYASPLDALLAEHRDGIDLWVHGHLHAGLDVAAEGVRVLANPRGYARKARATLLARLLEEEEPPAPPVPASDNPLPGRSPDFDWRLVVDLEAGLDRPLRIALAGAMAVMRRAALEADELALHLDDAESVPARAVREAHAQRIETFDGRIGVVLRLLGDALDVGTDRAPLALLGPPEERPEVVSALPTGARRAHAARQQARMGAWIAWLETVAGAAGSALRDWGEATRRMLEIGRELGLEARCVRLPPASLRCLTYSRRHAIRARGAPEDLASYGQRLAETFRGEAPKRAIHLASLDAPEAAALPLIGLEAWAAAVR